MHRASVLLFFFLCKVILWRLHQDLKPWIKITMGELKYIFNHRVQPASEVFDRASFTDIVKSVEWWTQEVLTTRQSRRDVYHSVFTGLTTGLPVPEWAMREPLTPFFLASR